MLSLIADADRSGAPAVVVEAIKLVEGGLATLCDEVWLVTCDPAAQRARLAQRATRVDARPDPADARPDPADADARIAAQGDLVARLAPSATRRIDTSGSIAESRFAVETAFASALARQ